MKRTPFYAPALVLLAALVASNASAQTPTLPPDDQYVTVSNGHLSAGGQRVRLWCAIGGYPNPSGIQPGDSPAEKTKKRDRAYRDAEATIARFVGLGFNGLRMWSRPNDPYIKGDGSESDVVDYFVSIAKAKGFRIWLPSVSTTPAQESDANLVNEPATEAAWKAGLKEGGNGIARVWDPRLERAQIQGMQKLTNHVNLHTGLRWGDDPVFAIWELTNEEWWMMKMVGGEWQKLPGYFRQSLARQWHEYLAKKYGSEAKVIAAWSFLLPGESLEKGSIQIAPIAGAVNRDLSGMDPQARLQVEAAMSAGKQQWTRDDFVRQRGADVLEFFLQIQLAHKQRLRTALKGMGKSPQLGPVVFDTGIGYEAQSQYLHQNADAVAHDAYITGFTNNQRHPRYPWFAGVEEWPKISQDVPWLEHNRVEGKPYLCYETQIMQPAKYRAEFPLRILALAAIQDWDAVCWHYWGNVPDITTNPNPWDKPMDNTTGWHPQGYHYTYDAVQNAMMRAAAHAFRNGTLKPAPNPTKFTFGRKSLYDPASMDYGGSYGAIGRRLLPTTYQNGVRMFIDPNREDDLVEGPTQDPLANALPNLVKSTDQITWDVGRGGLKLDSPGSVGFTGFFSRFGEKMMFANGITLSDVKIAVPKAMPYPEGIAQERYIGFFLTTEDGQPLARTKRATLALKSTSFNSGFKMLWKDGNLADGGTLPVLEARVEATVRGRALVGMRYSLLDWSMKRIGGGTVGADGVLRVPNNVPVWVIELTR
ncbi:MAG: hypothetical protein ACOYON_02065 [Fimbriimonas sp.]